MSNTAVKWFRQVSPQTTLTDEQITLKVYDLARSGEKRLAVFESDQDFLSQAQDLDKQRRLADAPSFVGEGIQAIKSGVDATQAKLFDTLAMVGSATGMDTVRDFGQRKAQENLEEAAQNAPTLPDFSEVENIGEGIRFLVGLAGSQAPQLAAVLAGTAAGAVAAPAVGASAALGAALGGGSTAFTQTQNYGDLIRSGIDEDEAVKIGFGTGVLSAALESLVPVMAVTPLFKAAGAAGGKKITSEILKNIPERQAVSILKNAAKEGGVDGVAEAATEVAQEALTIASEVYANRDNPDFELSDDDINNRLLNAAVAGGILGAGLGGVTGAATAGRRGDAVSDVLQPDEDAPGTTQQSVQQEQPDDVDVAPLDPRLRQDQDVFFDQDQEPPVNEAVSQELSAAFGPSIKAQQDKVILDARPTGNVPATLADVAPLELRIDQVADNLETALINQDVDGFNEAAQRIQELNAMLRGQALENSLRTKLAEVITRNRDAANRIREQLDELRNQGQRQLPEKTVSQPEIQEAEEIAADVQALQQQVEQEAQSEIQDQTSDDVEAVTPTQATVNAASPKSSNRADTLINQLDDEKSAVIEDTQETRKNIARQPFVLEVDETTDESVLVDGARTADRGSSRTSTRKVVFFEDTQDADGRVIGLPVYKDDKGVVRVARPDFMVSLNKDGTRSKRQLAVPYSEVISDGRLAPIYAVRVNSDSAFKASDPDSAVYYDDAVDLERRLIGPAQQILQSARESSVSTKQTSAKVDDIDKGILFEGDSQRSKMVSINNLEGTIDDPSQAVEVDPFTELQGLVTEITGTPQPTELQVVEALVEASSDPDNAILVESYMRGVLADSGLLNDKKFLQLPIDEIRSRARQLAASRIATAFQAGRIGQDNRQDRFGGESQSFFSIREDQGYPENAGPTVRGKFFSVLENLSGAGVRVSLDQAIAQEFGEFSPSRNSISLALNDTQSPSLDNFRLLLHEAAHAVAASLPSDVYNAVQRAVSRFSREKLNLLNASADPRIRENNPDDLPPQELAEEIFAETLAQEFGDRALSQTLAARIFRILKDIYFRSAMLVQRMFGRNPSPEIADAYARNRFEQLVGGDAQSIAGFLVPGFEPNIDLDAYDRFSVRRSQTEQTKANMDIAVYNEEAKVQRQIALELENSDTVREHALSRNLTPKQAVLDILGITDAQDLAERRANQIDPQTGRPTQADPTFTVDAFKGQSLRKQVQRDLLVGLQRVIGRITNRHAAAELAKVNAEAELQRQSKDLMDRHEAWQDRSKFSKFFAQRMRSMMKNVVKDVKGVSHQFGEVVEELRWLRKDLSKKHLLKTYGKALRKLSTTNALPKNFNILNFFEALMSDPNVSLLDDIATIKENLRQSTNKNYDALTQDTPESDALLASLIAYARKDDVVMMNLEMSRMDALADRHAIRKRLNELLGQSQGDLKASLMELKDNFQLEARARVAYLRAKRKRDQYKAAIRKAEKTIAITGKALERYRDAESKVSGDLGIHAQFVWSDGALYFVPESADSTSDDVRRSVHKLKLSGDNSPTKPSDLESDMANMAAWLKTRQDSGEIDGTYHDVAYQFNSLAKGFIRREGYKPSTAGWVWTTRWSAIPSIMKRFGSNNADAIGSMIREFTANLKATSNKTSALQNQINREYSKLIDLFRQNKSAMDHDSFIAQIYSPAVEFLSKQDDINDLDVSDKEAWNIAMRRLNEHMTKIAGRKINSFRTQFNAQFSKLLQNVRDLNDLYERELEASGDGGVIDDDIQVISAAGMKVPAMRSRIRRGVMTVPRSISNDALGLFRTMSDQDQVPITWNTMRKRITDAIKAYDESGAEGAWEVIAGAFQHPTIQRMFVDPIFNNSSEANILPSPGPNYSAPLIDVVQDAYQKSGGNLIAALEQIALEHDADPNVYIKDSLDSMLELYYQLRSALKQTMPGEIAAYVESGDIDTDSIKGVGYWSQLVPGVMLNARKIDHWPASWFKNTYFDDQKIAEINTRVAAQKSFGINNQKLASAFVNLQRESDSQTDILQTLETEANALGIDNKKDREAFIADKLGGQEKFKRLTELRDLTHRTLKSEDSIQRGLWKYFHGKESPTQDLVLYKSLIGSLAGMMINQPASAMMQTSELMAPFLNFGVSPTTIRNFRRASSGAVRNMAGGILNVFGVNWKRSDDDVRRYRELGLNDPALYDQLKDVGLRPNRSIATWSDKVALITQRLTQLRESSVKTKDSDNTPFRPLAPFSYYAQVLNEAIIIGNWKVTKEYVAKGLEAFSGDITQADLSLDQWASEIGLTGSEKDTFKKFMGTLENEYGLGFYRLVKEANDRIKEGKDPLSERTSYLLAGMALTNITQEGSIANMPLGSFNNSVLRVTLPLLGWPYRQSLKVANKILKNDMDRFTMQGLARALFALSVVAGGGLGISLAVDAYSEELLRKRRNMAPLSSAEGSAKAMAVLEHLTRVGTFGLFGDLGLELINVGTGESDLRGLSPERRIVAINSAFGLIRSAQAFLNQGFEADYNGVVRPILFAMGGNGVLQATQVLNTVAGFDNQESRAVRRTNVNNWLRAAGRMSGTELRKSSGGFSTKTPITPHITRMYLSALANDAAAFRMAYREAVKAAIKDGKSEPESYIKRTFASRNPLQVFRSRPDDTELAKILSVLPKQGKQDVRDAIRMFEHYNAQIGSGSTSRTSTPKKTQGIFGGGIF